MKRKKIVLYNPMAVFYDMPLALLSIGSMLDAARYEVVIIDGRVDERPLQQLIHHAEDALCVGVTALTGSPLRDAIKASRAVKAARPGLPVIWGGWHPSLFPKETLRDEPAIDISVQGQGEVTFKELVYALECGADLSTVRGITYREASGEIIQNPGRALEDMNFLPRVNYDLIDVEKYFKAKKRRQFDYIGSSGPWVSEEKYRLIENFKFYNKMAGRANQWFLKPLGWLARLRCQGQFFKLPVEKLIIETLVPRQELS